MKRKLILIMIVALVLVLAGNRIWRSSKRPQTKSISQLQTERGVPVSFYTAARGDISRSVELTGTVQGIAQADLISRITERVARVYVAAGQSVTSGQLLLTFDTSSPMAQFRQAKAALGDAEKNASRMKALLEKGAISRQVMEQAESGLEIAKANFEAARSLVEITSPIRGVVTSVNVYEDETVSAGTVLCTVARFDSVKVVVDASQTELKELKAGNRVFISAAREEKVPGEVSTISSSANPETRTFRVEIEADNAARLLKPGSFVTAEILTQYEADVLIVPLRCILSREGEQAVFVITEEERAELRPVTVGIINEKSAEILEGLLEGERVVLRGHELLSGGEKLKLLEGN
ncbi:MAG: efflux RND transporter periplasmic adaptor subunit [Candidatus Eiseniibacteriota bacterium]|nr:MAG: efflux RND transporter periplasmic adaptor subunit [Candidatus Eisenbacteria bacterium]